MRPGTHWNLRGTPLVPDDCRPNCSDFSDAWMLRNPWNPWNPRKLVVLSKHRRPHRHRIPSITISESARVSNSKPPSSRVGLFPQPAQQLNRAVGELVSVEHPHTCQRPGHTSVNAAKATGSPWCQAIRPPGRCHAPCGKLPTPASTGCRGVARRRSRPGPRPACGNRSARCAIRLMSVRMGCTLHCYSAGGARAHRPIGQPRRDRRTGSRSSGELPA